MSIIQKLFFRIKNISNQRPLFFLLGFCFLLISLIVLYSKNFILLGGEGNYFVNTLLTKELYDFTWSSISYGIGFPNALLNFPFVIFDFFYWLQFFGISLKVTNTLSIFLVYAMPFFSMLWLLKNILKQKFGVAFLLSLFYILNPFSTYHLHGMTFWNVAPLFVLPLIFGVIYKYYFKNLQLFLIFGFLTALLSYSFANIPYLGIFHIFLLISIVITYHLRSDQLNASHYWLMIKKFLLLEASFILFNAWWFINLVRFQLQDSSLYYTKDFAINWAKYAAADESIIGRIFSLKILTPGPDNNYYFSVFYNSILMDIILIIPFILIIWNLFIQTDSQKRKHKRNYIIIFGFTLLVFFLNKGINQPFEDVYLWMLNNIPFFIIFKSPLEKFSVLLIFLLTIALIPVLADKKRKWSYYAFIIYLAACSIPYLTLNFIPDFKIEEDKYVSRRYLYKESYFNAMKELNTDKLDYRYLSLPGSLNYQVTLLNHDGNKYYRGMDPLIYSINKPFIAAYSALSPNFDSIFNNFSNDLIDTSLNVYDIKKIVINQDIYPSFGFREKEKPENLLDIFSRKDEKVKFGSITIFNRENFLPHFYTIQNTIITNKPVDQIPALLYRSNQVNRSAVFIENQNLGKEVVLKQLQEDLSGYNKVPMIEFKKINPTKYRVKIHSANGQFPLVFSESFHEGWKAYLAKPSNFQTNSNDQISNYKILDGNADDQASKDELSDYINKGWVTTLGDNSNKEIDHQKWVDDSPCEISADAECKAISLGKEKLDYIERYNIDFISKNFQGTIQNDNLPSGNFYETWFPKNAVQLPETNHLMANGYANSWVINTDEVCGLDSRLPARIATRNVAGGRGNDNESFCTKNPDGTYDMELVIEFWPQRLFYIGLFISGTTLVLCLSYLGYDFVKRRKEKSLKEVRMTLGK